MEKTVCELFAGIGGFRVGLGEGWDTVYWNNYEPSTKRQWAHDNYLMHYGPCLDLDGKDTTNTDIKLVDKSKIPDFTLLAAGFPCQDFSVAKTSLYGYDMGIMGKKGQLWWSIYDLLQAKSPPYLLFENVDRLLKAPRDRKGRDFGIMLNTLWKSGYAVEWRVLTASDYGLPQRRKRIFIFCYKKDSFWHNLSYPYLSNPSVISKLFENMGFFSNTFPVRPLNSRTPIRKCHLPKTLTEISQKFTFAFGSSGFMHDGIIYTCDIVPDAEKAGTIGSILENEVKDEKYFIPAEKLYFTNPAVTQSDETKHPLSTEEKRTWQYLKGGKRIPRTSPIGEKYVFSMGAVPLVDESHLPARTMLTSEGSFNRSTHLVRDKATNRIRLLTPIEAERIQGFPDGWTDKALVNGEVQTTPERTRYFCLGNSLPVGLISRMEKLLSRIIEAS